MIALLWLGVALAALCIIIAIVAFALDACDNRFAGEVFFGGAATGFVAGVLIFSASVVNFFDAAGLHGR